MDEQPTPDITASGVSSPENDPNLSAQPQISSPGPTNGAADAILLTDTGYLQNLLQKGVVAQTLTLTLYATHLKIEDAVSGDVLEDVPIDHIKKTSRYFSSRLAYTLYGLIVPTLLLIKTDRKKYKISWVNKDKEAVMLGGATAAELSTQQNYTKNMQWVKAIQDLKGRTG